MSILTDILATRSAAQRAKLAAKSGLSPERLDQLSGGDEPALSELRRLSGPLGVPLQDLLKEPQQDGVAELLFRRSLAPGAALPVSAELLARRMSASLDVTSRRSGRLPWQGLFLEAEDSVGNAEANAALFRQYFYGDDQLGPITNLPSIVATKMGVIVYVLDNSEIDGASAIIDGSAFAFVASRFSGRMLFTLAHEVGHLVAHHGDDPFALIDEDVEISRGDDRAKEAYANAFASALLMPRKSVGLALKAIRRAGDYSADELGDTEINYLARIYGLSFWAAARRCEDLELLPRGGAHALNQKLIQSHGSAEQRADELGLPPRADIHFPKVPWPLMEAAVANIRAGEMSVGKAASALGVSVADLFSANSPTRH